MEEKLTVGEKREVKTDCSWQKAPECFEVKIIMVQDIESAK
jgi:hypothetical protein